MLTSTRYTDEARRSADFPLIERASALLEEIIGTDPEPVTAEWDVAGRERDRDVFRLRLSDYAGEADGRLTGWDFESPHRLSASLRIVWGFLLLGRLRRNVAAMRGTED